MYARYESARTRPNAGGYLVLVLVAAVVVTACVTTSCTNLAASPTTAPAPVPSTTTAAPPMTPTAVVGPSSTGTPHSGGAFPMPPSGACHLGSVAGQPMPTNEPPTLCHGHLPLGLSVVVASLPSIKT